MDILTEALGSMRTGSPAAVRTMGHAPWGLRLPPVIGAGFHVVLSGACWLVPVHGPRRSDAIRLDTGDVVFLRDGRAHILADQPGTPPQDEQDCRFTPGSPLGTVTVGGEGPRTSLLCGSYHLDQARPHPLVRQLPELVHLSTADGGHADLAAAVGLLRAELDRSRIGAAGIVPALIDSLLLYILRAWYEGQPPESAEGWTAALRDAAIAPALAALHADPAAAWTVEELAARVGLSRAGFARRFTALVGEPPMAYLTRWRMTRAAQLLRESPAPLSTIAARIGYGSEYAFAKAFKREHGQPPGAYRRAARGSVTRHGSPTPQAPATGAAFRPQPTTPVGNTGLPELDLPDLTNEEIGETLRGMGA
ncbi:AraC family transcriptional regulator [Streptomyces sp. JJ38]|uniref:AraC family transcriptional regulator n=1 Tax=Streptomyces sp. JJ38 TaxID=2738128 RepID=UPI001C562D74|nr:AraC family transcriptional regulator [Streptomyces sp. JJ38]MBW1598392.1 AraC family transcriptional regulator [Streptomyces sp. JJ38]